MRQAHFQGRILASLLAASCGALVLGQSTPGQGGTPPTEAKLSSTEARIIALDAGRSHLVEAPWPVKTVSVSSPDIADVQAIAPNRVVILGKSVGSTDFILWSEEGEVWKARVDVIADLRQLEASLAKAFPDTKIQLSQTRDVLVVSGSLARADQVKQLTMLLESAGFRYLDTTRLVGVQQVQIQVRMAEVSRTAIRTLGFNAFQVGEDAFGALTLGSAAGGALNPIGMGVMENVPAIPDLPFSFTDQVSASPLVTLFGGLTNQNFMLFVQALAEDQYLRILAEPNLVALSGEEARFLAGGEFPIPIVQGGAGGGSTSISVEYKEFGVSLSFRPTVLGDGKIRLRVAPEVSDISDTGAVEIEGFRIPSIVTRRAETTIELKDGQTFAMAGLLSNRKGARNSRIPLLGDLPIIGPLFRSVRYERGETELVVLVTASLVEPLSLAKPPPLPGSMQTTESDWEIFFEGEISGGTPRLPPQTDPGVFQAMKLGRLKGPGAWSSHDKAPARSQGQPRVEAEESSPSASDEPASGEPTVPADSVVPVESQSAGEASSSGGDTGPKG
jgi:pilus assembly protein CpaC